MYKLIMYIIGFYTDSGYMLSSANRTLYSYNSIVVFVIDFAKQLLATRLLGAYFYN